MSNYLIIKMIIVMVILKLWFWLWFRTKNMDTSKVDIGGFFIFILDLVILVILL